MLLLLLTSFTSEISVFHPFLSSRMASAFFSASWPCCTSVPSSSVTSSSFTSSSFRLLRLSPLWHASAEQVWTGQKWNTLTGEELDNGKVWAQHSPLPAGCHGDDMPRGHQRGRPAWPPLCRSAGVPAPITAMAVRCNPATKSNYQQQYQYLFSFISFLSCAPNKWKAINRCLIKSPLCP